MLGRNPKFLGLSALCLTVATSGPADPGLSGSIGGQGSQKKAKKSWTLGTH